MMDLVVRAPRLPVAGESLLSHSFQTFPGGKGGNQAVAAARLGAEVSMVGRIGPDRFGAILLESLEAAGVDCSNVSVGETGTGVAVPIVLDSGENAIFAIPQANLALGADEIESALLVIEGADMLMVQFEVGMEATLAAMRIARHTNVPVMLNPAPIGRFPPEILSLATVIVANEVEAASLVPGAAGDHKAELAGLERHAPSAVITLGQEGAGFRGEDGAFVLQPAFRVEAIDSVGAGDAFCAGLAVALCEGYPFEASVRFGQAAGALAATKPGAQAALPVRAAVEELLHRDGTFPSLSAFRIDDGEKRLNTESTPGFAH
jgi:ribokinase